MPEPSFGFGPAWARGAGCCGKPAGCTNMSGQCLMRNHPWKRQVLTIDGPEQEGTMAAFRDKQGEDPAEVTVASQEAVYVFAGRLEDGTKVVRGSDGVLHALAAVKRSCDGQAKPGWAAKPE